MTTKTRKTEADLRAEFLGETKLWRLLRMALADLRKCERSQLFKISMSDWIEQNGQCAVCLAGACMVKHGVREMWEHRFLKKRSGKSKGMMSRAIALDQLRKGYVGSAIRWLTGNDCESLDRPMPDYYPTDPGREHWWKEMRRLLADLRREDL